MTDLHDIRRQIIAAHRAELEMRGALIRSSGQRHDIRKIIRRNATEWASHGGIIATTAKNPNGEISGRRPEIRRRGRPGLEQFSDATLKRSMSMGSNDNSDEAAKTARAKRELRAALSDGAPRPAPARPRATRAKADGISVTGDGNTVIGGDNIVNYAGPPVIRKIVKVQTGVGVLTATQKATIKALIHEWAECRAVVRRSATKISALWVSLNKYMKVNKYDEIAQTDFDKAVIYLRRQISIVKAMPSAKKALPNWRTDRYASIMARAKAFPDGETRFRRYSVEHYGTGSLRELDDEQLEALYRHVMGWRR